MSRHKYPNKDVPVAFKTFSGQQTTQFQLRNCKRLGSRNLRTLESWMCSECNDDMLCVCVCNACSACCSASYPEERAQRGGDVRCAQIDMRAPTPSPASLPPANQHASCCLLSVAALVVTAGQPAKVWAQPAILHRVIPLSCSPALPQSTCLLTPKNAVYCDFNEGYKTRSGVIAREMLWFRAVDPPNEGITFKCMEVTRTAHV